MDQSMSLNFVQRSADRSGFARVRYVDANVPSLPSNIIMIPCFGDIRSTCILASFVLNNYKRANPSKYVICCSWSGWDHVFPYVDEFWTFRDPSILHTLSNHALNLFNESDVFTQTIRTLNQHFENVVTPDDLSRYFDNSLQSTYWEEFKEPLRYLPEIPSLTDRSKSLRADNLRRGYPLIVIHPARYIRTYERGGLKRLPANRDFWVSLTSRLIEERFIPVVYQDVNSFDISLDFADRCLYINDHNIGQTMAYFREADCVLDLFTGISRLAMLARCPYVVVDERQRYAAQRDSEIDDLMPDLHRSHVWSFARLTLDGTLNQWNASLLDTIIVRAKMLLESATRTAALSKSESNEPLCYEKIRVKKIKKMGVHFIKKS